MARDQIRSTPDRRSTVCTAQRPAQTWRYPKGIQGTTVPSNSIDIPIDRSQRGNKCWGYRKPPDEIGFDEDCLFLDVYAPSNVSTGSKLPVFFFIPAGGFNYNSGADTDRAGLVAASNGSIIVVIAHYRVGPYGFIASKEIQSSETASTNNGLKDQRKAMEWVQKHIRKVRLHQYHILPLTNQQ